MTNLPKLNNKYKKDQNYNKINNKINESVNLNTSNNKNNCMRKTINTFGA